MKYVLLALLASTAAGCGVDLNIESKVTIQQGVYGLLIAGCDTTGCQDQVASNEHVVVYAAGQSGSYATADSDRDGVYQIDLPAGDYTLCTSSCTAISVPANDRVRYDWTSGPGGGHWDRR